MTTVAEQIFVKVNSQETTINANMSVSDILKNTKKNDVLAVKINGDFKDLNEIVNNNDELEFYTFDDDEGKDVFWHSSSHILGNALVNLYKCKLVNGPATSEGFYYDIDLEKPISSDDFPIIEQEMKKIIKSNAKFETYTKKIPLRHIL